MKAKLLAAAFGSGLLVFGLTSMAPSGSALATTMQLNPLNFTSPGAETVLPIEKIRDRGRRHRYERRRHGERYRHRRGRHKHYYGGYWYAVPWWLGRSYYGTPYYSPYYDYTPAPRTRGGHVGWCLNRYRSYNPRTDTFRGYDGYDHRCISPYSY